MFRSPDNNSEPNLTLIGLEETPRSYVMNPRMKRFRNTSGEASFKDEFSSFKEEMKQMLIALQADTTQEIKKQFMTWKSESDTRMTKIENSLKKIERSYSDLEKAIEFASAQYDDIKVKSNTLENECKVQRALIISLEDKLEEMQRISKINYIEIRNVPKREGETSKDLDILVNNLCKSINLDLPASSIKEAFRVPGKKGNNPTILTELNNNAAKNAILKAVKTHNISKNMKLNSSQLGVPGATTPVYVSEHLTPKARRLHFMARTMIKSKQIQFCWIANGKIFVKKHENSPAIQIRAEEQLEKMASPVI